MLLSMPNGVARVGCTAEIVEVLERHRDGRLDILTVGRMPFRVVELFAENPLLEGHVDYLEDREVMTRSPRPDLVELYETCHTLLFGDYPKDPVDSSPQSFSYLVTGTLPMDLLWKQQVLELRSEAERQERLVVYLRGWAPHLQKAESARGQAAGNKQSLN
jgi:Lon protease-like protein